MARPVPPALLDVLHRRRKAVLTPCQQSDLGTTRAERLGGRPADSSACSGDDHDLRLTHREILSGQLATTVWIES